MDRPVANNRRMTRQDYFVLAGFVVIVVVAATVFYFLHGDHDKQEVASQGQYDGVAAVRYAQDGVNDGSAPAEVHIEKLQYFDPNTADSTVLLGLGLRPWQVRSIYKYRSRGGRYYTHEDFAQLYGLTLKHYQILRPYIRIKGEVMARDAIERSTQKRGDTYGGSQHGEANRQHSSEQARKQSLDGYYATHPRQEKLHQGQTIDINTADTTELKKIPGIGSYYARRIVELRKRRGAFASESELLSIRNFPETALEYMKAGQNFPPVNVNQATLAELEHHPLINHTQAVDILSYRRLRGRITSISNLENLPSFTPAQLARLEKYIVFQ